MNRIQQLFLAMALCILLAGCGGGDKPKTTTGGDGKPTGETAATATLPAGLFVTSAPAEAKNITDAKAAAKEGDEVTIRGVIGGAENPFVDGRAIVTLIDMTVPSCEDNGEECPTPWDYCCVPQEEKTKTMATVQVVDASGKPLKVALSGASLKPYNVLVVRGKVGARPSADMLVINATAIHVEATKKEVVKK